MQAGPQRAPGPGVQQSATRNCDVHEQPKPQGFGAVALYPFDQLKRSSGEDARALLPDSETSEAM